MPTRPGSCARAGVSGYPELVRRSVEEPEWFWPLAISDLGLEFSRPWTRVLDDSRGPAWTTWFVGGTISIPENCVHRWARSRPAAVAAVGLGEDGSRREVTFAELSRRRAAPRGEARSARRRTGRPRRDLPADVTRGGRRLARGRAPRRDPGPGLLGIRRARRSLSGCRASEAKVVITQRESSRRGKTVPMLEILEEARARRADRSSTSCPRRSSSTDEPGALPALQVDSETPYLLTYTSGTTGPPKGVVHVQGGFLVSIAREVAYQADVHEGDVVHFATDMGWIMGPWTLVGAGALGATIVFAEGAPDWPSPDRLWRTVEQERVTALGLSPTLARALLPHGAPTSDLSSLRTFVTTGEPWNPEPYRWLFEDVGGSRVPVINCTGGTEVGACFLSRRR